jgi:flavodoxin I
LSGWLLIELSIVVSRKMRAVVFLLAYFAFSGQARRMRTSEISPSVDQQTCTWVVEPKSELMVLLIDASANNVEHCMHVRPFSDEEATLLRPRQEPVPAEALATYLLASNPALARNFASLQGRSSSSPQMSTGLYYSTSTGNTETVAEYIANAAGVEDWKDIGDADDAEVAGHDSIIVGAPTWHTGADSERSGTSWDEWLYNTLPNMDFSGKKVAIFGVGDSSGYGDNYCDAAGELYDCFTEKGAKVFGMTPSDTGFDYTESKSVLDGKFVGAVFDEDNYPDESESRANAWIEQLKSEGFM